MPRHLEHFAMGLNTARDSALLELGEMSVMQNMIYRPGNLAPARASGRTLFGTAAGTFAPVYGIRNANFDNGDNFLMILKSASLSTASVGDTGTFSSLFNFTSGATALEAIHYSDEWFLFGPIATDFASASGNIVTYLSGTAPGQSLRTRAHGLAPNLVQVSTATGAGTWTAGATGYFEYWFTEVFEYVHNGVTARLEGTFNGSGIPTTLFVSSTAMQASINLPGAPRNSQAQKWVLYRAGPKALETDQEFPTGFKLAEGQFGVTTTVLDGGATVGSFTSPNATATNQGGAPQFALPTNVFSSNNQYATMSSTTPHIVTVSFPTFSVTEPITSIAVTVEGGITEKSTVYVNISNDGGTTWGNAQTVHWVSGAADAVVTVDPGNTWGLPFSAAELVAGKFLVAVYAVYPFSFALGTTRIDHIAARITSAGTEGLDESHPFPAIVVESSSVDAALGSHGQPPPATTADIFQGCLVTNSRRIATNGTLEKSFIRYSLPNEPDYFPDLYYLDFNTGDNDEVVNLKTLNERLGVFLRNQLWRVNYLPTEADADFGSSRGQCRQQVSAQRGCVNAMCAVAYEGPDGHTEIAFVSNTGIHSTDLFAIRDLTSDLNWRQIMDTSNSTAIALLNDPENEELLFYYKNTNAYSGLETYKCLHLSYNQRHLKAGGRLKVSGPVHMRNAAGGGFADLYSAWAVLRSGGNTSIYLGYGATASAGLTASAGAVLIENGTAIPASDSTAKLRTRAMWLSGMGDEFRADKVFTYVASANTNQSITITPYITLTEDASAPVQKTGQTHAWTGEKFFELAFSRNAEGLELEIAQASNNQGHWSPQHILIDWTDYGQEDSGK